MVGEARNLADEVKRIFNEIGALDGVSKSTLITTVEGRHGRVSGPDRDFALWSIRAVVTRAVEALMREVKASEERVDVQQLPLPGYDRLQRFYIVTRNDEQMLMPVDRVTDDEFMVKISDMQRMRAGLDAHIKEIHDYMEDRRAIMAASHSMAATDGCLDARCERDA